MTDGSDGKALGDRLSPRAQRALRIALHANLAGILIFAIQASVADEEVQRVFRYWFCALFFLSAAICLVRGRVLERERLAWSVLGASIAGFGLGWVEFIFV